jgi:chaperone BCS1
MIVAYTQSLMLPATANDLTLCREGRILIMTTNHIEKLDEALIRPGRIDKKAKFQHADAAMTSQLFEFIFQQDAGKMAAATIRQFATLP